MNWFHVKQVDYNSLLMLIVWFLLVRYFKKDFKFLQASYVRVLQKQMRGETGYRFEYFDLLHPILGKEIDPVEMGRGKTLDVRDKK